MKNLFILLILLIVFSCSKRPETISQVDFKAFENKINSGKALTQEDVNELMSELQLEIKSNTIGRKLPDLQINNASGDEFNLPDFVKRRTIIEISDAHCGFGKGCTTEDLPGIVTSLKRKYDDFDVICLVMKTKTDYKDPEVFNSYLAELKPLYTKLYIADEDSIRKLNITGSPTQLLLDKNKIVVKINTGMAVNPEYLYDELAGFLKDTQ
jgi:hypothetical protein